MASKHQPPQPKGQTKYIKYVLLKSRLDSFEAWPGQYVPKTPDELAIAGFFYIGSADRVTCFQCGITLRDWEEEHDPIAEHQRFSENCQFINRTDFSELGVQKRTVNSDMSKVTKETHASLKVTMMVEEAIASLHASDFPHTKSQNQNKAKTLAPETLNSFEGINSDSSKLEVKSKKVGKPAYQENKKLRAQITCKLCKTSGVDTVFLPCGHLVTCSGCSHKVDVCIICCKLVAGSVKTFFS